MENSALSGTTQDLNTSRAQALQAIINSISPEILGSSGDGDKLTPQQIRKLSDKLEEFVGEGGLDGLTQNRNEKGEIVNEDGLPIIEITEQLPNVDSSLPNKFPIFLDEEEALIPLASLSESERRRLRIERDRILGILEEEERKEQARGDELDEEQRRELLQKRKDAAKIELEKLNAAKKLQKKMGKALLRNMGDTGEREQKTQKQASIQRTENKKGTVKTKKCVTFADDVPREHLSVKAKVDQAGTSSKQGATNGSALLAKASLEKYPMKMHVLERFPASTAKIQASEVNQRDSDDESLCNSSVHADSDSIPISQDGESPTMEEEEYDLDVAQSRREIALEYYKKRGTIGEQVSKVMMSGEHEWDQPEVSLDATLSSPPPKPAISRFKANRVAAAYHTSVPSTSIGLSALPAASSQSLQRAVRVGKLEGDQLVGADESASENEDGSINEMLDLLKRNQIHDDEPDSNIPSSKPSTSVDYQTSGLTRRQPTTNSNPSKFKPIEPPTRSGTTSPTTPVSHVGRSSPKLPSSPGVVDHPMLPQSEYISSSPGSVTENTSQSRRADPALESTPMYAEQSRLVDSPSFRSPVEPSKPTVIAPHPFPPYPDASSTSRPGPLPVMSSVRESSGSTDKNMSQGLNTSSQRRVSRFMAERN